VKRSDPFSDSIVCVRSIANVTGFLPIAVFL